MSFSWSPRPSATDKTGDDSKTGSLGSFYAASPRKRPCPSGANQRVDGDGDSSSDEPASCRQRSSLPSLSLLAKCALNMGDDLTNSHHSFGDQNHQMQLPPESIGGAIGHPRQNSRMNNNKTNILQLPGHSQTLTENISPTAISTQNTAPVHGTNLLINQEMMCIQPGMQPNTLASQYISSTQRSPIINNGPLLYPLGMAPQQLLNYAVLINILNKSAAQGGNAAMSNIAFNYPHAMVQPHSTIQAGGNSTANPNAAGPPNPPAESQQQNCNEYKQIAIANQPHMTTNNEVQTCITGNLGGGGDQPALNRAYANVSNTRQDVPSMRNVPLWTSEDEQRLSTQQCWLRKQIETFPASSKDVRTRGRNRLLDVGQLGIRCIHCKNLPQEGRGTGSSYFPAAIKSIYQSAQNMLTSHYKEDTCPLIPRRILQQMRDAGETSANSPRMAPKAGASRAGGGKEFWATSAKTITGLVDTTVGIRYCHDIQNYQSLDSIALGTSSGELDTNMTSDSFHMVGVLTRLEDREKVTDFCYILMSQFFAKNLTMPTSDVLGGDDWDPGLENEEIVPSIGLCCQFCKGISHDGKQSKGIFLSSKADTMMRNKNMARMFNHLLVCAPEDLKTKLMRAKNIHLPQSDRLKKGWKKRFFENVCDRMHQSV